MCQTRSTQIHLTGFKLACNLNNRSADQSLVSPLLDTLSFNMDTTITTTTAPPLQDSSLDTSDLWDTTATRFREMDRWTVETNKLLELSKTDPQKAFELAADMYDDCKDDRIFSIKIMAIHVAVICAMKLNKVQLAIDICDKLEFDYGEYEDRVGRPSPAVESVISKTRKFIAKQSKKIVNESSACECAPKT
jgi:hypothetical protein